MGRKDKVLVGLGLHASAALGLALWMPALHRATAEQARPSASASDEADQAVEILQGAAAIDGPSEGGVTLPTWERVRVELRIKNRLSVEVRDLELEIALVSSAGTAEASAAVIPGWSFRETFSDAVLPPLEETFLRITRELPARRTSPPADEIAYRAHIKSYRLSAPDVDSAMRLLLSSHESDQMAALKSYEGREELAPDARVALGRSLAKAIADLPEDPAPPDALRMLFSIRALGTLGDASQVNMLLELPGMRAAKAWGKAVIELATKMSLASDPDRAREEPRLQILPSWAKDPATLKLRAGDALEEAVQDAIMRMGDAAVPSLLSQAYLGSVPGIRARAHKLLHALGRTTARSQLALRDRAARLSVIEVLGAIGTADPDSVPALAEILRAHDKELRAAAIHAIEKIGAPAVDPLVGAIGTRNDDAILAVLGALGPGAQKALARAALRYGLEREKGETIPKLLARLRHHLFEVQRTHLEQELERALELARQESYVDAFRRLDQIFTQDPDLYLRRAKPIAETYLARGQRLFSRGDYDAAISTLREGQSIYKLDGAQKLLMSAQHALARGYLELGDLERAERTLQEADPEHADAELRTVQAKLFALRANEALGKGDYGKARTLIDRARALKLGSQELNGASRRLMLASNLAIIIVLALLFPAFVLVVVIFFKRRIEAARMQQLASAIDRGEHTAVQ